MLRITIRLRYLLINFLPFIFAIYLCELILQYTTTTQDSTTSRQDFGPQNKPQYTTTKQDSTTSQQDVGPQNKPNIIMFVADDLGFNDVPWHNKEVVAHNLQKLAEEGIILEQSYVMPLCTPTRSAIMSGMYPFTIGRQDGVIPPLKPTGLTLDVSIIPEYLKPLGYESHAIGKWHLGFCKWEYTPTKRGFKTFRGFYNGRTDYYTHRRCNEKTPGRVCGYDFRHNENVYKKAQGSYSTYEIASYVETILHSGDPSVPKFLYVAFQSVHDPLQVPRNYTKPYANIKNKDRRNYLGMVTAMDEAIGRITTALKETGHYNNSVIVFTTDNGGATKKGASNLPLRGGKFYLLEGGTRGAALIHSPLLPNRGRVVNNLIHATDWLATFVGIAGGIPPKGTDSINQWDALRGLAPPPRKELVYNLISTEFMFSAAIRVGDYKLMLGDERNGGTGPSPTNKQGTSFNFNSTDDIMQHDIPLRLYDLKSDPEERTNLASQHDEITTSLINRLLTYRHRYVTPDNPEDDLSSVPKHVDGAWSPGWC